MQDTLLDARETRWICERAQTLGFALCGVAPAEPFPELAHYSEWLERGYAGEMQYLNDARRADPRAPLPEARSLIVCGLNYNSPPPYSTAALSGTDDADAPRGWISRYAWGDDYHQVLWSKLNALVAEMRTHFAEAFEVRAYADTGPIHERAAAKYAGLGWLAKNTLLINQSQGSWLFLGTIITSLPLTPSLGANDLPPADRCGTCRACIDACPTEAIVEPYVLDASRCIAYLTIELRGSIPENLRKPMGRHVFGCDICQDVCPWNRKSPRTDAAEFQPRSLAGSHDPGEPNGESPALSLYLPGLRQLVQLTEAEFRQFFRGSPIKRTKWRGLVRNACIALGNAQINSSNPVGQEIVNTLQKLSAGPDPVIAESALWALSRIQRQESQRSASQPAVS
jgi:epoxyqueuosine reductase